MDLEHAHVSYTAQRNCLARDGIKKPKAFKKEVKFRETLRVKIPKICKKVLEKTQEEEKKKDEKIEEQQEKIILLNQGLTQPRVRNVADACDALEEIIRWWNTQNDRAGTDISRAQFKTVFGNV